MKRTSGTLSGSLLAAVLVCFCQPCAGAATYYADPVAGKIAQDGSQGQPWSTLEEIARSGTLKQLKGGDTLILRTGYHGVVTLEGDNDQPIVIEAAAGATPTLAQIQIPQGRNWTLRGLTVSTSLANTPPKGSMVVLGARGRPASHLVLENCFVYTTLDSSAWGTNEWLRTAGSGIETGSSATQITLRNNYVFNVRWGIALNSTQSLAEGNVVENYSADAFRITRDDITVQYNVVKNVYVGSRDGDANHDDCMQCFVFNQGKGLMRKLVFRGNLLINREDDGQKFKCGTQGIGLFDGPLVDFVVVDNVALLDTWHAVSLYDAQNCVVSNNAAYSRWTAGSKCRPWVSVDTKLKQTRGNVVVDNMAFSTRTSADKTVQAGGNVVVTEAAFKERYAALLKTINEKFGSPHPVAKRLRAKETW